MQGTSERPKTKAILRAIKCWARFRLRHRATSDKAPWQPWHPREAWQSVIYKFWAMLVRCWNKSNQPPQRN
jgi:hypothetical protein